MTNTTAWSRLRRIAPSGHPCRHPARGDELAQTFLGFTPTAISHQGRQFYVVRLVAASLASGPWATISPSTRGCRNLSLRPSGSSLYKPLRLATSGAKGSRCDGGVPSDARDNGVGRRADGHSASPDNAHPKLHEHQAQKRYTSSMWPPCSCDRPVWCALNGYGWRYAGDRIRFSA